MLSLILVKLMVRKLEGSDCFFYKKKNYLSKKKTLQEGGLQGEKKRVFIVVVYDKISLQEVGKLVFQNIKFDVRLSAFRKPYIIFLANNSFYFYSFCTVICFYNCTVYSTVFCCKNYITCVAVVYNFDLIFNPTENTCHCCVFNVVW